MSKDFPFPFITFEGGEGAGKSTLISRVQDYLINADYQVVATREPGGTPLGELVRKWLLEHGSVNMSDRTELLLFLAARAQHLEEVIKPALANGKIVLCDRFNDSTIAYQGIARNLGFEQVESLCHFVCGNTVPNLTFFLDVDPIEGLRRARHASQNNSDRIESEKLEFHKRVREGMQKLAAIYPERIRVIDAHQTPDQVFNEVKSYL